MTTKPITVLMPVYNARLFVREAIDSILGQTLGDFELLLVNDGSTDGTEDILHGYHDPRIRIVHNPTNQGVAAALNRGLDLAQGRYVVRMDADDQSLPDRLEKQVRFMEQNPEVGVCGGSVQPFGANGDRPAPVPRASTHEPMACGLLFGTVLLHPTVILRGELVVGGLRYDVDYPHAEDYELWCRAAQRTRLAVLPEIVLRYRVHGGSLSSRYRHAQEASAQRIRLREVRALGIEPTPEEAHLHAFLARSKLPPGTASLDDAKRWLEALAMANRRSRRLPPKPFESMLAARLARVTREMSRASGG
jgi:glycosyltransferase involved in cell wall biosynthesis